MMAAGVPSPGSYVAIGLGVAAVGLGWVGFQRRAARGAERIASAAAVTVGVIGCALGAARVAMTLAAMGHMSKLLG